jgi:hypothetical protein
LWFLNLWCLNFRLILKLQTYLSLKPSLSLSLSLSLLLALFFSFTLIGCGGGGDSSSSSENNPLPSSETVFGGFGEPYEPHGAYQNIVFITGYDGLTEQNGANFYTQLLQRNFVCQDQNVLIDCERNTNNLHAFSQIMDKGALSDNVNIGETLIGDGSVNSAILDDVFPVLDTRQIVFSTSKCYANNIASELTSFIDSIVADGFVYDGNTRYYIKEDGDLVYAWGHTQKSVSWSITRKEYYDKPNWYLIFACEYFDLSH